MTDPLDPYRAPANDPTEAPTGELLPGLRSFVVASGAIASWFALRYFLGWRVLAVGFGVAAGVAGARGFANSLQGLHAEPPPRAGRALTFVMIGANGLVGAIGGLFALVSLAAGLGSCFDYTNG